MLVILYIFWYLYLYIVHLLIIAAGSITCTTVWLIHTSTFPHTYIRVDWYLNAGVAFSNLRLMLCVCVRCTGIDVFLIIFWCGLIFRFSISKCGNRTPFRRVKITCFGFVVLWKKKKKKYAKALSCIHEWSQTLVITPKTSKIGWLSSNISRTTTMITKY